jgi:hypothetical protein
VPTKRHIRSSATPKRFYEKTIRTWDDFYKFIFALNRMKPHGWIYRGQTHDWPLETTIERALDDWNIDLKHATKVEFQTIREFRRRTLDPHYARVHTDTLFCLSLMQHYGAPTRLLDCSYSPFAAAAFAMEKGPDKKPVVWCFSQQWMQTRAKDKTIYKDEFDQRNDDPRRNDDTFLPLYHVGQEASIKRGLPFVKSDNSLYLNERLTTQQGVFLCPADLAKSFVTNLQSMEGWNSKENIVKLRLQLTRNEAIKFVRNLKGMNLSFATLFPGLEGFARSIKQQLFHYKELADSGAGQSQYSLSTAPSRNSNRAQRFR